MSKREDPEIEIGAEADEASARTMLRKLARRLRNPGELGGDALEMLGTLVESSDRVKSEAVRLVAREVRNYLEELKLKDDLRELITGHSLEVHMSLSLKKLVPTEPPAADEGAALDPTRAVK